MLSPSMLIARTRLVLRWILVSCGALGSTGCAQSGTGEAEPDGRSGHAQLVEEALEQLEALRICIVLYQSTYLRVPRDVEGGFPALALDDLLFADASRPGYPERHELARQALRPWLRTAAQEEIACFAVVDAWGSRFVFSDGILYSTGKNGKDDEASADDLVLGRPWPEQYYEQAEMDQNAISPGRTTCRQINALARCLEAYGAVYGSGDEWPKDEIIPLSIFDNPLFQYRRHLGGSGAGSTFAMRIYSAIAVLHFYEKARELARTQPTRPGAEELLVDEWDHPLVYEQRALGVLLYSVGRNGLDEGGEGDDVMPFVSPSEEVYGEKKKGGFFWGPLVREADHTSYVLAHLASLLEFYKTCRGEYPSSANRRLRFTFFYEWPFDTLTKLPYEDLVRLRLDASEVLRGQMRVPGSQAASACLSDPWGHRLRYEVTGTRVQLYSIGPNGVDESGNGDDIVSSPASGRSSN